MAEALDRLRKAVEARALTPFVGMGLSSAATNGAAHASWRGLLLDGIELCERVVSKLPSGWAGRMKDQLDKADAFTYIAVADELSRRLRAVRGGREFDSWIERTAGGLRLTPGGRQIIEAVRALGDVIVTTNYDTLIEDLEPRWSSSTWTDSNYGSAIKGTKVVLHLHGIAGKSGSAILGSADNQQFSDQQLAKNINESLFALSRFIFIGYGAGLNDPDVAPLMDFVNFMPEESEEHYILVTGGQLRQYIVHELSPMITPVAYGSSFGELTPFLQKLAAREKIDVSQNPEFYEQRTRSRPRSGSHATKAAADLPEPTTYYAGVLADVAEGEDRLGISAEVNTLCDVIMARDVTPPLSIGLFGDWGTGKSFFMARMRKRIARLAEASEQAELEDLGSNLCAGVCQIEFNAWHYIDTSLWASLAARIFDQLANIDAHPEVQQVMQDLPSVRVLRLSMEEQRKQAAVRLANIDDELSQEEPIGLRDLTLASLSKTRDTLAEQAGERVDDRSYSPSVSGVM